MAGRATFKWSYFSPACRSTVRFSTASEVLRDTLSRPFFWSVVSGAGLSLLIHVCVCGAGYLSAGLRGRVWSMETYFCCPLALLFAAQITSVSQVVGRGIYFFPPIPRVARLHLPWRHWTRKCCANICSASRAMWFTRRKMWIKMNKYCNVCLLFVHRPGCVDVQRFGRIKSGLVNSTPQWTWANWQLEGSVHSKKKNKNGLTVLVCVYTPSWVCSVELCLIANDEDTWWNIKLCSLQPLGR